MCLFILLKYVYSFKKLYEHTVWQNCTTYIKYLYISQSVFLFYKNNTFYTVLKS